MFMKILIESIKSDLKNCHSLAVFNSNDNGPVPHFKNTCNIIGNLDGTVFLIIINVLDYEAGSVMT